MVLDKKKNFRFRRREKRFTIWVKTIYFYQILSLEDRLAMRFFFHSLYYCGEGRANISIIFYSNTGIEELRVPMGTYIIGFRYRNIDFDSNENRTIFHFGGKRQKPHTLRVVELIVVDFMIIYHHIIFLR